MAFVLKVGIWTPNGRHNSEYDATYPHSYLNQESKKISNDQELIQSDPISCPQNQKGNN